MRDSEYLFKSEILDKKKHLHSSRAKTGRGASKSRRSGILPLDRMSPKERKAYTKAGEVKVSYMYDTILSREEFEKKPTEEQTKLLTRWREIHSNTKIMKEMGITSNNTFYGIVNSLNIPQKKRGGSIGGRRRKYDKKPQQELVPAISTPVAQQEQIVQQLITEGLHLEYNGKYNSEQLEKIFTKLQLIVGGDEGKYRLSLSITESR